MRSAARRGRRGPAARRAGRGRRNATPVPAHGTSKYHGCRIEHEVALGTAALLMRAGSPPPEGRDEAISFLLDAHGLDELIIHLAAIRDEVLKTGSASG